MAKPPFEQFEDSTRSPVFSKICIILIDLDVSKVNKYRVGIK